MRWCGRGEKRLRSPRKKTMSARDHRWKPSAVYRTSTRLKAPSRYEARNLPDLRSHRSTIRKAIQEIRVIFIIRPARPHAPPAPGRGPPPPRPRGPGPPGPPPPPPPPPPDGLTMGARTPSNGMVNMHYNYYCAGRPFLSVWQIFFFRAGRFSVTGAGNTSSI